MCCRSDAGSAQLADPNLKVLPGVSLLQDDASELVCPVLPIFLTVTIGAPADRRGPRGRVAEGVAALTKLLAGRLSNRVGPRPLIAVVPAVLSVLLVAAVRDLGATRSRSKVKVASPVGLSADLRRRLLVLGLFSPVNFSDTQLLRLLRAHDLGLSTGAVIGAYIVYNAVYAAASYPAGGLAECTDCVGKAWVASLAPADGRAPRRGRTRR